ELLQGVNSWASGIVPEEWHLSHEEASAFGGCAPPDKPHTYTIEVYALDTTLKLKSGFYMNEMLKAMQGHVLAKAVLEAEYPNE
ncbi:MAG: YbhB/YbcL family Raf kinase inhibitor-like protein, partial [Gammaproteobacteria bacterium]|nr:YbhB/YbcL family Raf kinase inhibitor-like protein [Gammaproteobacteria bacterium]